MDIFLRRVTLIRRGCVFLLSRVIKERKDNANYDIISRNAETLQCFDENYVEE